jgi:hypothetical protein
VLCVEDWAEIRRLHRSEQLPIKMIARVIGVSRNTVRAALASDGPPSYVRRPAGSIVDALEPRIRYLLAAYPTMPATVTAERIGWDRSMTVLKDPRPTGRRRRRAVDPGKQAVPSRRGRRGASPGRPANPDRPPPPPEKARPAFQAAPRWLGTHNDLGHAGRCLAIRAGRETCRTVRVNPTAGWRRCVGWRRPGCRSA